MDILPSVSLSSTGGSAVTSEDSRQTFGGGVICLREASEVGGEDGKRIARGLRCEVRIAPPGGGLVDGMPSLTSQHWDVSSQGMGRSPRLRSTT